MSRYAFRFRDGTIRVRRITDDQEIARFQVGARSGIESRVFRISPDGRYLATCDLREDIVTVWDIDRRAVALNLPGLTWVQFSPDSRRIVVDRDGELLLVYDLASGQPLRRFHATAPAKGCVFRHDGTQIAGVYDRTCRVLDAESGRLVREFPLRAGTDWVAWSPDGATLATSCADRKIYLWDVATGIPRGTLEGMTSGSSKVAFHPAGTLLASNGGESRLRLWDPVLCRPWLNLTGGSTTEFSQDGRIAVSVGETLTRTRLIRPWNTARSHMLLASNSSISARRSGMTAGFWPWARIGV
jgi:WD40 repeat protein